MNRTQTLVALRAAIAVADADRFALAAAAVHPADVAGALAQSAPEVLYALLGVLPLRVRAETFGYLEPDVQHRLAEQLSRGELAELFVNLSPDERADLFNQLHDAQRESFLPALAQAEREDIRALARYPEDTVGAVMTSDYATVPAEVTAAEAIAHLRNVAPDKETIYEAYVVDAGRSLLGSVSLKDLVISPPEAAVARFMQRDPLFVRAEAPRGDAARVIAKYDLLAIPVLGTDDKLLIASSGNAGSQSATLMVRALATGDVVLRDWGGLLLRELAVSIMLGVTMALVVSAIGFWRGGLRIALVVALTMLVVVIAGSLVGMALPFILDRFKIDPAASSAPLITSIADAIGVIVYFALATAILGLSHALE